MTETACGFEGKKWPGEFETFVSSSLDIWILDLDMTFGGSTGPFLEQEPPLKGTEVER